MEEFILDLFLAGHELHVVHQQKVCLPVLGPEVAATACPNQLNELIDEVIALDVDNFGSRIILPDHVGDGIQQMSLAQTGIAVDQQGVVVLGGMLRHRHRGGVGQLIAGTYHEGLKREILVGEAIAVFLGRTALKFQKSRFVQDLHFKLHGEEILKGGFDVFDKQGFDVSFFKVVGTVQIEGIFPDVHRRQFIEPGGDGRLREILLELLEDVGPHISDRIQIRTPLLL